jgi:cysteine desulfurase/selenocysteine lyase
MNSRGLSTIARASVSYLTTDTEIDALLDRVRGLTR